MRCDRNIQETCLCVRHDYRSGILSEIVRPWESMGKRIAGQTLLLWDLAPGPCPVKSVNGWQLENRIITCSPYAILGSARAVQTDYKVNYACLQDVVRRRLQIGSTRSAFSQSCFPIHLLTNPHSTCFNAFKGPLQHTFVLISGCGCFKARSRIISLWGRELEVSQMLQDTRSSAFASRPGKGRIWRYWTKMN